MTPEYKAAKEASVSLLGGGGIWEINRVTLVAPAAACLWALLQSRQSFFKPYSTAAAFADFLTQCCAILFAITVYSSQPQVLVGFLILPAVVAFLQPGAYVMAASAPPTEAEINGKSLENEEKDALPIKPFITTYRGSLLIISCASILAVDFPIFPRRFAKTEAFGTSLMDMGVGSFVFAGGLVAARQQLKDQTLTLASYFRGLANSLRHSIPLLGLGLVRLYSVKSLDYAEHVSEYGVHWNFFFTLALLGPAVAILQPLLRILPSYNIFAFVIAICYELWLFMIPGVKDYMILSERIPGDWLSQNREGVFSMFGYLAIYIAGMGIGINVLPRDAMLEVSQAGKDGMDEDEDWLAEMLVQAGEEADKSKPKREPKEPKEPEIIMPSLKPEYPDHAFGRLAFWTVLWFIFAGWAMWKYGPRLFVSRRMANLAYVCWVCSFNTAQLFLFCLIETAMFPGLYVSRNKSTEQQRIQDSTSKVMQAFNRNGLALFLLANLLTGLVNMTMPTLTMGDVEAMTVLVGYMATLTVVALGLDHYNISIKL